MTKSRYIEFWSLLLLVSSFFLTASVHGQNREKIKLIYAKEAIIDKTGDKSVRKLIGEVEFKHKQTKMYCDSAYLYPKSNSLRAYSNVRIVKGDSIDLTGDSLYYDGNSSFAELRGNITLNDGSQNLRTQYLDYDVGKNFGYYQGGGLVTNLNDSSTLKSEIGYYYADNERFKFKNNVKMESEDYTITSDTLEYDQKGDIVYFFGPTDIVGDSSSIFCKRGFYNRKTEDSEFVRDAKIVNKDQQIEGDSIIYNQQSQNGEVFGNSVLTDTVNNIMLKSDYAYLNGTDSISYATGNLLMEQRYENDTLYLHSDTLYTLYDSTREHRVIRSYHKVKFFKSDIQGKCDSLLYSTADSTIKMFIDPVIWSDANQMSGTTITIRTYDGNVESLFIEDNAFIVSVQDSTKEFYNQVKGRTLLAHFRDNKVYKIDVNGNGETIYYAEDDEDKEAMGMNRLACSEMTVYMDSNQIDNIRFYNKPEATLYPLKDLTDELQYFRYFEWRGAERPKKREDVFVWRED
ncbi:MAG: OstA-like protein [Salibacter sp.]|uniref:OstA-like protein n=1 Tax=Salibacter sp. TaxID=2010995 RepID=UPI0028703275|nr:OstA-like protein [Salibacter sp.]MDR9397582.1 OstA-like protein [Salibacter sp.]